MSPMPNLCSHCGQACGRSLDNPDVVGFHVKADGQPCEKIGEAQAVSPQELQG